MNTPFITPLILSVVAAATLTLSGCGNSGPPRGPIVGRVTIGGQPLKSGRILFTPIAPNAGPSVSAPIVEGHYILTAAAGPIAGMNRVEIDGDLGTSLGFAVDDEEAFARRGNAKLPPNPIPASFNRQSTLSIDVAADTDNTYNVEIPAARHMVARPPY